MRIKRWIALALGCLLLTGCGKPPAETTLPVETTVQTQPTETTPPTTVPPTTVPPTTEPEIILPSGVRVIADGDVLESGSVVYEEITYVKAAEFFAALDSLEYSGNEEEGYHFVWNDTAYDLAPDSPDVLYYQDAIWIPVTAVCELMEISMLDDPDQDSLYCTSIVSDWGWETGVKIPILMYHGVTDDTWGTAELFVSPANMEAQIKYLVENGYDTITFEDWTHLEDFDKPVMLTFDDGYMDNYLELFPILQKYNAKATIFAITVSVDVNDKTMTSEQAKEMMDSGLVSIQSHTFNHPHLSECSPEELHQQMRWSKYAITRMTGYEPFVLCYPYGDSDPEARAIAMEYYKFGLNMNGGLYTTGKDESQITRFYVKRETTLNQFINMIKDAGR